MEYRMNKFARGLALCALLVAASSLVRADEETKAAQKDILDVTKEVEGGGKVTKTKLEAIKKKYEDLNTIMHVYKPREKGGLGVGPMGKGDGIEMKIIALGKKQLSKMQLDKESTDLVKMAHVNVAVAEIAALYVPKPKAGKGPKEWQEYVDQMKKSSFDLAKAVKGGNPTDVKTAANNLNNSCNMCHSDFRD